jgi:hypothetical protein
MNLYNWYTYWCWTKHTSRTRSNKNFSKRMTLGAARTIPSFSNQTICRSREDKEGTFWAICRAPSWCCLHRTEPLLIMKPQPAPPASALQTPTREAARRIQRGAIQIWNTKGQRVGSASETRRAKRNLGDQKERVSIKRVTKIFTARLELMRSFLPLRRRSLFKKKDICGILTFV